MCPTRIIHDEILESLLFVYFNKIYKFNFPILLRTVPQKKYAQSSSINLSNRNKLTQSQKKSFLYLENTILNLFNNTKDKNQFKINFKKFMEDYIKTKSRYSILLRAFKLQFEKFYVKTTNKNFKIFLNIIKWLEKN